MLRRLPKRMLMRRRRKLPGRRPPVVGLLRRHTPMLRRWHAHPPRRRWRRGWRESGGRSGTAKVSVLVGGLHLHGWGGGTVVGL